MTLAHDVTGSGPAVLLIHSTACDRRMWDPQVPALATAGYRVIRCDLRGYGESPMPEGSHDDTRDVTALLDALGVERLAVIGASGGGRVALDLAARAPERVTALALLCTALRGREPSAELRAFGEREDALLEAGDVAGATALNVELWVGPEADEQTRAKVRVMQRRAFEVQLAAEDAQEAAAQQEPLGTQEPRPSGGEATAGDPRAQPGPDHPAADVAADDQPALSAITAPMLLISGGHDLPDFREIAVQLAGTLPHARHIELDWAGHLPSLERPDLTNPLLLTFLQEAPHLT